MTQYNVIGIMSGTSLDGVDIAFCSFSEINNKWSFTINKGETIAYDNYWEEKLKNLSNSNALQFVLTHTEYGHYLGKLILAFVNKNNIRADFIASHGHTIFHQPLLKTTSQIGDGASIAAICNLATVCDFRSSDIALGGQGAPLVPIGDKLLFAEYDYCLNLGGIANISMEKNGERIAFDICPVNIVLNLLAEKLGLKYDESGNRAETGRIDTDLLEKLNDLDFYKQSHPKSLGKEWVDEFAMPFINNSQMNPTDLLRTFCEHIAIQIAKTIGDKSEAKSLLITGGGTFNNFLIGCIKTHLPANVTIEIPSNQIINYKEALIFAFLGVLRMRHEANCLKTVTGASKNAIGGAIYVG